MEMLRDWIRQWLGLQTLEQDLHHLRMTLHQLEISQLTPPDPMASPNAVRDIPLEDTPDAHLGAQ